MANATIKKKPNGAVSNLGAPARSGYKMKSTWKVPAALVKGSNKARAEGLEIDWTIDIPGKDPKKVTKTGNEKLTSAEIDLNNLWIGRTKYSRASFYPLNGSRYLYGVTCTVYATNKKGKGKAATATRKFAAPRAPSISDFSFNQENGELTCTINTDAGGDYYERYDTWYTVYIENTKTGQKYNYRNEASTSTSIGINFDASDYQQLSFEQYIMVRVSAFARGFAGNSKTESKTFYISYPAQTTITETTVSSKDSTGKCTIGIKTNSSTSHPVDRVKLEYLANVTYKTAEEIPGDASPTESNIIDDAQCTAMAIPVASIMPDRGKYTWIRIKSYHAAEEVLYRYSAWHRVEALETPAPTAADDDVVILSASAGSDGRSAIVHLGWNADGQDDSTGTELSWADEEDMWKSTKKPSEYEFEWSDGAVTEGGVTYHDSATVTIKDLDEATKYFIKARRYLTGDVTTYSEYSNTATVLTSERPETVVASCERYVPTGKALTIYWTFSGNGLQTEWQIVDTNGTVLAKGEGSIGSTQISADRLAEFATNNAVTFRVETSTGSGFVASEYHTVTIIDNPVIALTVPTPLTVQPLSFMVTSTTLTNLIVIVSSQGASGQFPQGLLRQTEGDTIHSGIYMPEWTENQETGLFEATITIPSGLDFWDLGSYTVEIVAVDRVTGLRSNRETSSFDIAWANPAADPDEAVTVTPIDTYDEEGYHRMAAEIALTPPVGAAETDLYDIYRLTGDGAVLIGQGFPLTYTAYDEYAPFGAEKDLAYRVAIRTVDGDVEYADIPYVFDNSTLRFDWAGGFLELPYNLAIGDTYKKDVEIRQHMDGSVDGYWKQNISRSGKLSTDVIKIEQQADIDNARQLARYAGPVFVRTPEGTAYEADVQVTDMSAKNKSIMAISIDADETGLTAEFILPTPYTVQDEEENA